MQRRRIVRAPQTHGRAEEQREDSNRRADHVERRVAAGHRRNLDVEHLLLAESKHCVRERLGPVAPTSARCTSSTVSTETPSIGYEHVAGPDPGSHRPAARGYLGGGDALPAAVCPQHSVFELLRRGADSNIERPETQQNTDQGKEPPASQRTRWRSMDVIFHWIDGHRKRVTRLQTLYPEPVIWP